VPATSENHVSPELIPIVLVEKLCACAQSQWLPLAPNVNIFIEQVHVITIFSRKFSIQPNSSKIRLQDNKQLCTTIEYQYNNTGAMV